MLGMQFVVGCINPSILHKLAQQGLSITSPLAHHGRRLLALPSATSRNHGDSLRRGSTQFVTTLPKNANRDIVLELLVTVLPPPTLQYLILVRLNGVELRNRLVGLEKGFYLQVEVTGNFRLGREITSTPHRLLSTLHEVPPPSIQTLL